MRIVLARAFYLAFGLGIAVASLAYGKHSVDRGYFVGKSGQHFNQGEPMYKAHLLLLAAAALAGGGLALAGCALPSTHPMLNEGYGNR